MNLKNSLSSLILILGCLTLQAQQRSDSLSVLNLNQLPTVILKPQELQTFKLDIQPMRLVEPEIYLFGPSDLVPGYSYDFRNPPKSSFYFSSGYPFGSAGQGFSFNSNSVNWWMSGSENVRFETHEIGKLLSGNLNFEMGNQQYKKDKYNEYLTNLNVSLDVKKLYDTDTSKINESSILAEKFSLSESVVFVPSIRISVQTNPLFFADNWKMGIDYLTLQSGNSELSGSHAAKLYGDYSQNLTVVEGFIRTEILLGKSSVSWVKENQSVTTLDFGIQSFDGQFAYRLGIGLFSENLKLSEQSLNAELSVRYHSSFFHQSISFKRFNAVEGIGDIADSPFWFAEGNEPNQSDLQFSEMYPIKKTANHIESVTELIPSKDWKMTLNMTYSESNQYLFEKSGKAELTTRKQLKPELIFYYFLNPVSFISTGARQFLFFDKRKNTVFTPFEALITVFADIDYTTRNQQNRFKLGVFYHMDEYFYRSGIPEKVDNSTEIVLRFEDFHWKQVNFFSDLRLYLRNDDSAVSRYVHYNSVFIGLNFNF